MKKRNFIERFGKIVASLILVLTLLLVAASSTIIILSSYHHAYGLPPFVTQTLQQTQTGIVYDEAKGHPLTVIGISALSLLIGFFARGVWNKQIKAEQDA